MKTGASIFASEGEPDVLGDLRKTLALPSEISHPHHQDIISNTWEQHGLLPAVSTSKKEQRTRLKRHLDQRLIKNMADRQNSTPLYDKDGQESSVHKSEARFHKVPQEQGSSQGTHMPSQQREWAILPNVPVKLEQQPAISFSWAPRDPSVRPKRFSSVTLQPSATPGPLLLQPQVPNATKQDSVVAVLEWLKKLEAAEALLALQNSSQDPCDSSSLQHRGSMPGSCLLQDGAWGDDGERGPQPPSSRLPPKPASSVSLSGHLECMSYLT